MSYPRATSLVKRATNGLLELLASNPVDGRPLPSEADLAAALSVSRTPLRSALRLAQARGVLQAGPKGYVMVRAPQRSDYFAADEVTPSPRETADAYLLEALSTGRFAPGAALSELALARAAGVNAATMRDALAELARFGRVEKEPRRRWRLVRLDEALVDQLFDYREVLESWAVARACALDEDAPLRRTLADLLAAHEAAARGTRPLSLDEFRALDVRMHRALFEAQGNRFALEAFRMISMLIHVQLQPTSFGRDGMRLGLAEHVALLRAVVAGDTAGARRALATHLASARGITKRAVMA